MPRYFKDRKAREVRLFLEAHDFYIPPTNRTGDDDVYARNDNCGMTVKIPHRDNESIPQGTMDYICKCIKAHGFSKKDILIWWKENGLKD